MFTTRMAMAVGAVMIGVLVGACGSSGGSSDGAGAADGQAGASEAAEVIVEGVTGDRDGRAFGADDEMIERALNSTLKPDEVRWTDAGVTLVFDRPAKTAELRLNCTTAASVLADDEQVTVIYSDQEVDCTEILDR